MTPEDVRVHLIAALEADLVGPFDPSSGQEVLPLPPSRWYLTGFLAPKLGALPDPDDPDAEGDIAAGSESRSEDAGAIGGSGAQAAAALSGVDGAVGIPAAACGE
jgi:hypothetical protein